MWPFTQQERHAVLFIIFTFIAGISFKLIFFLVPPAQASLCVLDDAAYRPKVDINRAGYAELAAIPYVGAASAARILNYRRDHGLIRDPVQLAVILKKKPALVLKFSRSFKWPR